ncbi:substrate-binding domain-containing protein [Microbacterium betulae]|uniref:Substrate-binding domain-containing protein n=1 Tax=Microbacterium betulae TaxID=2981139 RepID=A0AA97FGP4_9MICO|nr:substrate-binding domain-containing protein [Microbacterium sp. AB]WOF22338.1 substrate-binding domain-containing protein [Microbacterium sp. AB]
MSNFPQRPTLADVAEAAGVSTVTVSRVVEGSAKVAEKTRQRVHEAMDRIGYFGNAAASQLVSGRATSIGIVTSNTADYGYASTIHGIERGAREKDMAVLIAVIEGSDAASVRKAVGTVASHALGGVVVMDFDQSAHAVLPSLPAYIPTVSATSPSEGSGVDRPFVSMDEYDGGLLAARHLIELGHRSIFVIAPADTRPAERRSLGVHDALNEARLPHYPAVRASDWRPSSGYAGAQRLLDDYGDRVTAISCANDEVALGAVRAVLDRGLHVPEDVSVIGFDDHPLAAYASPPLTTIHQDFETLGQLSFSLLHALIDGRPLPDERHVAPQLVVRSSTAPPHPSRGL